MTDQCKHCTVRGDIAACRATECFKHEDWYSKQLQAELEAAQANIAELKGRLSSHERLCVAGIYYTEEELEAARVCWEKMAVNKATKDIQAKAVMELISELSEGASVDGVAETVIYVGEAEKYASKLKEGK